MLPDDYWATYEHQIGSLTSYLEAVSRIGAFGDRNSAQFVWRGVSNSSYGMHSSLGRSYRQKYGNWPNEQRLRVFEAQVLAEARAWSLDWHEGGGRLSALPLLAILQHFKVPTRLIDFTFNPLVALCFAVADSSPTRYGRVFAVDVAGRSVSEADASRPEPWWMDQPTTVTDPWCKRPAVWVPPPIEDRIKRQQACFLVGGVPSSVPTRKVRGAGWSLDLTARQVRECMSIPFTLVEYQHVGPAPIGRPPQYSAFTIRVANRGTIRKELERVYGLSMRTLFADPGGLADYGEAFR